MNIGLLSKTPSAGRSRRALMFAALSAACLSGHHSTAPYDLVHGTIISGVVKKFEWENPHTHLYLDVAVEDNEIEHWTVELESPNVLHRLGWSNDSLKPGDRISVTGSRAKDGSFNMRGGYVDWPSGRRLRTLP